METTASIRAVEFRGQVLSKHSINAYYCHHYYQRVADHAGKSQGGSGSGSEGQAGGLGSRHYSRSQEGVKMLQTTQCALSWALIPAHGVSVSTRYQQHAQVDNTHVQSSRGKLWGPREST